MSASFTRKARYLTFGGLATLALGIGAQLAVVPGSSAVEGTTVIPVSNGIGSSNSGFGDSENDCPRTDIWGWHFVVTGKDAEFVSFTAVFQTAGTVTTTTFGPPTNQHVFVYTATDDTLLSASAVVSGATDNTNVVLSHTCTPTETPTPTPTETVAPTETATPTPTPTEVETTTPAPTETVAPTTEAPSETVAPTTEAPSETVAPTTVAPTTEAPTESVAPTEVETTTPAPSESTTPGATVLPTEFTNAPTETGGPTTPSPVVSGVKVVRPGTLPNTGTPFPVGLLLLLGVGMVAGGLVMTVAGEPAGGRHRR